MSIASSGRGPALCLLLVCLPVATPSQADCASLAQGVQTASKAGDIQRLSDYAAQIPSEPTCADDYRVKLARVAAYGFLREVERRLAAGADLADQEPLLRQSLSSARTWQALAMLGDLESGRKDYAAATLAYQEALGLINDPVVTPQAPPEPVIEGIFRKASESRMLAEAYVAVPVNHRSGSAEGLALPSVRGFVVQRVPIPVTFETGSTRFTAKGEAAASDLAAYLRGQGVAEITLIGHTDERGSDRDNQRLSRRRAEALARFLQQAGYAGSIHTEGAGESQPIQLSDPALYSQEQIWALNRRVELVRH
ncbi:OmpA family protein [Thiohalocapsa marina]|uniref:OmpA family protein n=1 Tax=Thiohalocapsa marina TaxID=424902 RepID=A0A5M8FGU6_9GAMM|nr:OmpA family protein [Thiohalocapsa marina]KAA6184093.1 OmpA family protein [Thiohalocapsa marina]